MKISVIGAGRVGQTLGRLAREANYEIGDVVCRSLRAARSAVRFIGEGTPLRAAGAQLSAADLVLISTPDDRITDAAQIIAYSSCRLARAVVLHTSGSLSSDLINPLAALGLSVGSCHPLQTFESPARAIARVPGSYFCIEGSPLAARVARKLVRDIGGRPFEIGTEMKSLYHAAAVLASGGVVALISISMEMLSRCGLSETESERVLLPLVEGTVASVRAVGPARALTGPIRRGDSGTVARNMKAIADVDPDWLKVYRLLGERGLRLAERAGTDSQSVVKLRRVLNGGRG